MNFLIEPTNNAWVIISLFFATMWGAAMFFFIRCREELRRKNQVKLGKYIFGGKHVRNK